ncbi:MAG: pyridoxamine 5'-phosphate oxidase family protein [Deinococcus sp.]|nr:pyridoxamine 5'-phosphate oxidase family protein [Deinococcus sp.]
MSQARNYWIGTAWPDGRPHAMSVWGLWLNEAFYFQTSRGSRKARNLADNPHLVVHLESGDDVVILEGVAEEITNPLLLSQFADAYQAKYQFRPDPSDASAVVYTLQPRVAFAWLETDFPGGATRWRF